MLRLVAVLVRYSIAVWDYTEEFCVASKFMIDTGAGVIDADYRGIVFVLLYNLSDQEFTG